MITLYENGDSFIEENASLLNENRHMGAFFFLDAPFLKETSERNFVLKATAGEKTLLAMKLEPYNLMLFGDPSLLPELLAFLNEHGYRFNGIMCSTLIGEVVLKEAPSILGVEYEKQIGMDFMLAEDIGEPSSEETETPTSDDLEEIYSCYLAFLVDCGLTDQTSKEQIAKSLPDFRILRKDGKIASFARKSPDIDDSMRVSGVYTRPEYRGRGYARIVVNRVKNEILSEGKKATLYVDQKNPISNHLYESLGFHRTFSQGIYLRKEPKP